MKRFTVPLITILALAGATLLTSCDWSSGSQENFNTSGGAGITNISGFYQGTFQGRAVNNTSNGNVNSFTIQQSGNTLNIVDNQGSEYEGSVGSPLYADDLSDGSVAAGAALASYQVSFTGKDEVAARDIEFSGTITLVAVSLIRGEVSNSDRDRVNGSESTSTVTNIVDGVEVVSTVTNNDTTTREDNDTYTFEVTEQSTQLRLRGTWVEQGGVVSEVDALASGVQGNITAGP